MTSTPRFKVPTSFAKVSCQYACREETLTFRVARSVVAAEGHANFAWLRMGSERAPRPPRSGFVPELQTIRE